MSDQQLDRLPGLDLSLGPLHLRRPRRNSAGIRAFLSISTSLQSIHRWYRPHARHSPCAHTGWNRRQLHVVEKRLLDGSGHSDLGPRASLRLYA